MTPLCSDKICCSHIARCSVILFARLCSSVNCPRSCVFVTDSRLSTIRLYFSSCTAAGAERFRKKTGLLSSMIDRYRPEMLRTRTVEATDAKYDPMEFGAPLNFPFALRLMRQKIFKSPKMVKMLILLFFDVGQWRSWSLFTYWQVGNVCNSSSPHLDFPPPSIPHVIISEPLKLISALKFSPKVDKEQLNLRTMING